MSTSSGRAKGKSFGSGPADSVLVRLLGPGSEWIGEMFVAAHQADPQAELWINEFGTDTVPGKHEAFLALVTSLVEAGTPLHGVGLQTHRFGVTGPNAEVFRQQLEDYAALGLRVAVTELDVVTQPSDPAALERQAAAYGRVVAACLSVNNCDEITMWNLSDADSWLDNVFDYPRRPTLFDETFAPKPAYYTVRQLLAEAVLGQEEPSPTSPTPADNTQPVSAAPTFTG